MRALFHVHSNYSYDGVPSLEELASWGEGRGLDLIFLSEHTNDFDARTMERLVGECDALAGRACRIVPGLEFPVKGGFHVLGYNLRSYEPTVGPADAARFIRGAGGLAVLAHPGRYGGRWPDAEVLGLLDGLEVWNARYEGRFLPSGSLLAECIRRAGNGLVLLGGQDLHEITSNRLIVTTAHAATADEFLARVRRGEATFGAFPFRLGPRGRPGRGIVGAATAGHALYRAARRLRSRLGLGEAPGRPKDAS